jgi:PucR C-terminal helix-turn-helix domain
VPLAGASGSLRWAGQTLALARRGLIRTGSVAGAGGSVAGGAGGTVAGGAGGTVAGGAGGTVVGGAGGSVAGGADSAHSASNAGRPGSADGIVWSEDHLSTLVLLADADLAATLSRDALAPLRRLRPDQADRLAGTLLAWLESADDANAAALRLHVHPQTIRYRLRQVSELFGDALTDPDARFRLLLALRVRGLLGSG